MGEDEIKEVLEYAEDLEMEFGTKDNVNAFNQAVMRLRDATEKLTCIDSFDDINA